MWHGKQWNKKNNRLRDIKKELYECREEMNKISDSTIKEILNKHSNIDEN